jgi:DNA-binding protein HU-beta
MAIKSQTKPVSKPESAKSTFAIVSKKTLIDRISNKISKKINLTKNQIEAVLTEYLEQSKQALIQGQEIRLVGYYTFKTAMTKPRVAMNLQTKQKMNIPAKRVPKIKFSDSLKEAIAKKK